MITRTTTTKTTTAASTSHTPNFEGDDGKRTQHTKQQQH